LQGTGRENAETVIESALEWLNTNNDEPGFRFAYVDVSRPSRRRKGPMKVVFRKCPEREVSAHTLCTESLTSEVDEDDETGARVGELIGVLALGVMSYHWQKYYEPPLPP
jgi:hypothetical protein